MPNLPPTPQEKQASMLFVIIVLCAFITSAICAWLWTLVAMIR